MSDLMSISMQSLRVAIVGVGGIGESCAQICAQLGAHLILADRAAPQATVERIRALHGAQADAHALDVGSVEDVKRFCSAIGEIDALIVTAAILPEEREMAPGSPEWEDSFQRVFNVNLRGPMLLAQLSMQKMIERKTGRIVILGSLAGRSGGLLSGAQYASSKGALHTLVRWLALRAASHGVCVNGLAPGATATPMLHNEVVDTRKIPAGRLAQPLEIARVAAFLASPAASYMHGAVVDVNGGACFS